MAKLILLNKPFNVLSQFTSDDGKDHLAHYVKDKQVYAAGRLDYDSEGLLLLTDNGQLNQHIANPKHKLQKTYLVLVEGEIHEQALQLLRDGVQLKDGTTAPAEAKKIHPPTWLWTRPIRIRKQIKDTWIELKIKEGKNRQVRRMVANVGFPCLRLVRSQIGPWEVKELQPGQYTTIEVDAPKPSKHTKNSNKHSSLPVNTYRQRKRR